MDKRQRPPIKRSYSSILVMNSEEPKSYGKHVTWVGDILGPRKEIYGGGRRRYNTKNFLGTMTLLLLVLFGSRTLMSYDMFQTATADPDLFEASNVMESYIELIKGIPSSRSIKDLFTHYASKAHLAGSDNDYELAKWTQEQFMQFGIQNTSIETYYPYLNYPTERKLSITTGDNTLLVAAGLKELEGDTPTFHAYSADGNVTGSIVYVNYGRAEDFALLLENKIDLNGTVALMRDGEIPSGVKVQHAEMFGCVGALIYADPADGNKHLGPTGVRRESVQYGFVHPGDPYTPGVAATVNVTRSTTALNLPKIPSLPISWNDALPFLRATQGLGIAEPTWAGGIEELGYFSGPSLAQCNLVNYNDFKIKHIWNVMAHIPGQEESEKAIIIGNHRDAWDKGAADPSSGSAVLLELARVFGILLQRGWKPRRSIILASWDANEFGSVGSTEYVEDKLPWLQDNAVAYLDVNHAVAGPHFNMQASPLLHRLLTEVASMVIDPRTSTSVYESWIHKLHKEHKDVEIPPVGSTPGLDSIAFFEHAGISSLSMSFDGDNSLLHSNLDSISWMEQAIDPTYEYHQTMVKLWGLLALRLSSDTLLPLWPVDYVLSMMRYADKLTSDGGLSGSNDTMLELPLLTDALESLHKTSVKLGKKMQDLSDHEALKVARHNKKKNNSHKKLLKKVMSINECLVAFERSLISSEGLLLNRPWYKHAVFGPSAKSGLLQAFPSIMEARDFNATEKVQEAENQVAMIIRNAHDILSKQKNKKSKKHHFIE